MAHLQRKSGGVLAECQVIAGVGIFQISDVTLAPPIKLLQFKVFVDRCLNGDFFCAS
jgi:hypothetical protein